MLAAHVVTLEADSRLELPPDVAPALHAWFLNQVGRFDSDMAELLHTENQVRPFTVSGLRGVGRGSEGQILIHPGQTAWMRVTSLETELSKLLAESVMPALSPELNLPGGKLKVASVAGTSDADPWAGETTYESLVQTHLASVERPDGLINLEFVSPTSFKRTGGETALTDGSGRAYRVAGHDVTVPLPGLVFDSYLRRWNAFAPVALNTEVKRYAEECVSIGHYRLRTVRVSYGSMRRLAFLGRCQFRALVRDQYWLRLLNLLADFAFFCGTGRSTARGMGMTQRLRRGA